jgi:hypothetical protein
MKEGTYIQTFEIDDEFQRKGVGTFLYNYIEKDRKIKLRPSNNVSSDGKAFWKARRKVIR